MKFKRFISALLFFVFVLSLQGVSASAMVDGNRVFQEGYDLTEDSIISEDGLWAYKHYTGRNAFDYFKIQPITHEGYLLVAYLGNEKDVTLPKTIDGHYIDGFRFNGGDNLVNVTIPKNYVVMLGFNNCAKLKSVTFSREYGDNDIRCFEHPGGFAFFGECKKLEKVVMPNVMPYQSFFFGFGYSVEDRQFFDSGATIYGEGTPNVEERRMYRRLIPDSCFYKCVNLKEIVFPEKVDYITEAVFKGCYSLETIVIPEGVTRIYGLTVDCRSLKKLVIPSTTKDVSFTVDYSNKYFSPDCVLVFNMPYSADNKVIKQIIGDESLPYSGIFFTPDTVIKGDMNGDGMFNINDVTYLQLKLCKRITIDLVDNEDFNGDGKVNIYDATTMQLKLAGRID